MIVKIAIKFAKRLYQIVRGKIAENRQINCDLELNFVAMKIKCTFLNNQSKLFDYP